MADSATRRAPKQSEACSDERARLGVIRAIYRTVTEPACWPRVLEQVGAMTGARPAPTVLDLCRQQVLAGRAQSASFRFAVETDEPSRVPQDPGALLALYSPGLSDHARELVELLLPHVQQATRLHLELQEARLELEAAQEVMKRLRLGVVLVDESGRVCFTNPGARQILATRDGLRIQEGEIRAREPDESRQLTRLVSGALHQARGRASDVGGAVAITRPSGKPALQVIVAPVPASNAAPVLARAAAALFLSDPDLAPGGCAAALEQLYSLTPCEARVAQGVVAGRGLQEVADSIGVGLNTVRTHLQHVFQKTGTRRQAELVQLLLRGPLQLRLDQA